MGNPEVIALADLPEEWRALAEAALAVRAGAHAPYSRFLVGAALRGASGRIFTGCNVENASYGLTVCAERVALWSAVAAGERHFAALAVASESGVSPCGACRQVLIEFAEDLPILVADAAGRAWFTSLKALLPMAFSPASLGKGGA
ncbi:MAG: cytidine deaminase [Chloroflexota bacterium]